jgi:hypothetical protein
MKSRMILVERCVRSISNRLGGTPSIPKHHSLRGCHFSSYNSRYQSSVATQSSAAGWEEMDLPLPEYGRRSASALENSNATNNLPTTTNSKHCDTCTCNEESSRTTAVASDHHHPHDHHPHDHEQPFPCGNPHHEDSYGILPPPLPSPEYSVHKRILPPTLTASSSPVGRKNLLEAMSNHSAESYFSLTVRMRVWYTPIGRRNISASTTGPHSLIFFGLGNHFWGALSSFSCFLCFLLTTR